MSFNEIPEGGTAALYGAGKRGQDYLKILSILRPDLQGVFFIDSFHEDLSAQPPIVNIDAIDPEALQMQTVIICSDCYLEIAEKLRAAGLYGREGLSIYKGDWFSEPMSQDEIECCVSLFKGLLSVLPKEAFVYDALGRLETARGNHQAAYKRYASALRIFPDDVWSRLGCAEALRRMDRFEEADAIYASTIAQFPENPAGWVFRARSLKEDGRLEEALAAYETTTSTFPDNPDGHLGLAETLQRLDRLEEAERIYRRAISRFPDRPEGYLGLALVAMKSNRLEEADALHRDASERFAERFPDRELDKARIADLFLSNNLSHAEHVYEECAIACGSDFDFDVFYFKTLVAHYRKISRNFVHTMGGKLYKRLVFKHRRSKYALELLKSWKETLFRDDRRFLWNLSSQLKFVDTEYLVRCLGSERIMNELRNAIASTTVEEFVKANPSCGSLVDCASGAKGKSRQVYKICNAYVTTEFHSSVIAYDQQGNLCNFTDMNPDYYTDVVAVLGPMLMKESQRIEGGAYPLYSTRYFYHWCEEGMPALLNVLKTDFNGALLHSGAAQFVFDALDLLGVPDSRIQKAAPCCHVEEAFITPFVPGELLSSQEILDVRETLLERAGEGSGRRLLYLKRDPEHCNTRCVANGDEVESLLAQFGFDVVVMDNLPFPEQVRMVRDAQVVVTPLGASQVHTLFMKRGGTAIVLFPRNEVTSHCLNIAKALDLDYRMLVNKGVGSLKNAEGSVVVNADLLKLTLNNVARGCNDN